MLSLSLSLSRSLIRISSHFHADHDVRPGHARLAGSRGRGQHARRDGDRADVGGAAAVAADPGDDAAAEVAGLGPGDLDWGEGCRHEDDAADSRPAETDRKKGSEKEFESALSLFFEE